MRPENTKKSLIADLQPHVRAMVSANEKLQILYSAHDWQNTEKQRAVVVKACEDYESACSHVRLHARPKAAAAGKGKAKAKAKAKQ